MGALPVSLSSCFSVPDSTHVGSAGAGAGVAATVAMMGPRNRAACASSGLSCAA